MKKQIALTIPLILLCLQAHGAKLDQEISTCAAITDDGERLGCFDALASTLDARPENQGDSEIPEDLGLKKPKEDKEKKAEETYAVVISKCEQSRATKRMFFYLDNGQVWKQKNDGWITKRNCASTGKISKDFWGYTLYIDQKKDTIRVSRVQ